MSFRISAISVLCISPALSETVRDLPRPPERPAATTDAYGPPLPLPPINTMPPPVASGSVCRQALMRLGATFEDAEAPNATHADCTVENPVRLTAVNFARKAGGESIVIAGSPLLSCDAALAVTGWVQTAIAPLARGHFDAPLQEIAVGGGFECRQRNHQANAPRSEHSYGRALDLMAFKIGGRLIKVEKAPPADTKPFLDAVWASGCGLFSTALGPEADAFHATHIHVDLQPRRSVSSKFCE